MKDASEVSPGVFTVSPPWLCCGIPVAFPGGHNCSNAAASGTCGTRTLHRLSSQHNEKYPTGIPHFGHYSMPRFPYPCLIDITKGEEGMEMDTNLAVIAGAVSTTIFALSTLPMLFKAFQTKDLKSYKIGRASCRERV